MPGPAFNAVSLAATLSDLEFELLIRERIRLQFAAVHAETPNLSESYNYAEFCYQPADRSFWVFKVGETFTKEARCQGEVLSATAGDAAEMFRRKSRNILSGLLVAPHQE